MRASSSLSSSFTCLSVCVCVCVVFIYITFPYHGVSGVSCVCVCTVWFVFWGVGIWFFFSSFPSFCVVRAGVWWTTGSEMRPGLRNPEFPDIFSSGNSSFGLCIYMGSIPGAPSSINRFLRFPSSSSYSSSPHSAALSSFPLQDPILIYLFIFIYFLFFFLSLYLRFFLFFFFYWRRKIRSISLFFSAFAFPSLSLIPSIIIDSRWSNSW